MAIVIRQRYDFLPKLLAEQPENGLALAPFRGGSVGYLNAAPLTRGIEDEIVLLRLPI